MATRLPLGRMWYDGGGFTVTPPWKETAACECSWSGLASQCDLRQNNVVPDEDGILWFKCYCPKCGKVCEVTQP